ncbi:MAG: hypothetical protein E7242_05215 [Lachnospiraceae bacterium]|nr:hypothetical protein [Lachnospiraceae bacterium]
MSSLSSNLIKAMQVLAENDSVTIDNNDKVREKVETAIQNQSLLRKSVKAAPERKEEADQGLDEESANALLNAEYHGSDDDDWDSWERGDDEPIEEQEAPVKEAEEPQDFEEDFSQAPQVQDAGFNPGINAPEVEVAPSVDYAAEATKIIDNAYAQADEILAQAKAEAEEIKAQAHEDGYNSGLNDGKAELDLLKESAMNEIDEMRARAKEEMEQEMLSIEPTLVDTILEVFRQVTDVLSEDRRDIILQLVNNVLRKVNISHDFIIRVSKDDYSYLTENKSKIYGAVLGEGSIEIVEDIAMSKNQCIIETASGMYDCSLDVQLDNLISEIKMLSCINNDNQ